MARNSNNKLAEPYLDADAKESIEVGSELTSAEITEESKAVSAEPNAAKETASTEITEESKAVSAEPNATKETDASAKGSVISPVNTKKQQAAKPMPMIHIDEFLLNISLRPEQKAGFRVYAGKAYATEKRWKEKLAEYQNREYRGGSAK